MTATSLRVKHFRRTFEKSINHELTSATFNLSVRKLMIFIRLSLVPDAFSVFTIHLCLLRLYYFQSSYLKCTTPTLCLIIFNISMVCLVIMCTVFPSVKREVETLPDHVPLQNKPGCPAKHWRKVSKHIKGGKICFFYQNKAYS